MLIGQFKVLSFQICWQVLQSGIRLEGIHGGHFLVPGEHYCKSQRRLEVISGFHLTLATAHWQMAKEGLQNSSWGVTTPPPPSSSSLWPQLSQIKISECSAHLKHLKDKQLRGNQKASGWTKGKAIYYFLHTEERRAIENARGAQWWTELTSKIGLVVRERKP